ncbi:hypothetical protein KGM_212637 [Danaus plexippus plexippus]|uniref:Uncharacterized protein n=1 Tax=Danaus plexippus plexippus TaxID=278856 RepID=A0A212ERK0_DANPL|nr:hypothetical protein KGM_212637 [Danaus plexippus plexippus]
MDSKFLLSNIGDPDRVETHPLRERKVQNYIASPFPCLAIR